MSALLWSFSYLVPSLALSAELCMEQIKNFCAICYIPRSCEGIMREAKES